MDLKIELNKLYSLHQATMRLEHAVRNTDEPNWQPFKPSSFVYAYFTFNSIYAYDWQTSIQQQKAMHWPLDANRREPKQSDQYEGLIRFCCTQMGADGPKTYADFLQERLLAFGITNPAGELKEIRATNLNRRQRDARDQFPRRIGKLLAGKEQPETFRDTLIPIVEFIYLVRNNIFHGTKTSIEMEDEAQQRRLLIYTSVLIALNGLFFCVVKQVVPRWREVPVNFAVRA